MPVIRTDNGETHELPDDMSIDQANQFLQSKGLKAVQVLDSPDASAPPAPVPLQMPAAAPEQPDYGPWNIRPNAGAIGGGLASLGVAASPFTAGLSAPAAAGTGILLTAIGGAFGEALGQLSDHAEDFDNSSLATQKPPSNWDLQKIGLEGATQGGLEAATLGMGALANRALAATPGAVVSAAEHTATGRAYRVAQAEAKVLEAKAAVAAVNDGADQVVKKLMTLPEEVSADVAREATYALKQASREKAEQSMLFAVDVAKGAKTRVLTKTVEDFLGWTNRYFPKPGARSPLPVNLDADVLDAVARARKSLLGERTTSAEMVPAPGGGRALSLGGKEAVTPGAEEVPLDALMYGRSALKAILTQGEKSGLTDIETAALRKYVNDLDADITKGFNSFRNPAKKAAWSTYLSNYADGEKLLEASILKLSDTNPRKIAAFIGPDSPRAARIVRDMAATKAMRSGAPNSPLLQEVQGAFLDGLVRNSKGEVAMEGFNSKLRSMGESPNILFQGPERASLNQLSDMGKKAEELLLAAAKDPTLSTPQTLMQKAWERATGKLGSAGVGFLAAGGGAGAFYHGATSPGTMAALAGAGIATAAAEKIPPAILRAVAEDPKAYQAWVDGFKVAGKNSELAIQSLSRAIRIASPMLSGTEAPGAGRPLPRPLPRPGR